MELKLKKAKSLEEVQKELRDKGICLGCGGEGQLPTDDGIGVLCTACNGSGSVIKTA
jgi:hypothetical protein